MDLTLEKSKTRPRPEMHSRELPNMDLLFWVTVDGKIVATFRLGAKRREYWSKRFGGY